MALPILSLAPVGGEWSASATLPRGKDPSVPIEYEAGWAPELVLMFWRRDSLQPRAEIKTPDHPHHGLLTVLNMLSHLHI